MISYAKNMAELFQRRCSIVDHQGKTMCVIKNKKKREDKILEILSYTVHV